MNDITKSKLILENPLEPKEESNKALRIFSWPLQLGILFFASCFRYSVEPGGTLGTRWLLEFPIVNWRPEFLDWGPLPLIAASVIIVFFSLIRFSDSESTTPDPGPLGILICMAGFALSRASNESFMFTLIGIWLCVIASIKFKNDSGTLTGFAALFLIAACIFSAYMLAQTSLTLIEFFLIVCSIITGVCSTGFSKRVKKCNSGLMGLWFSFALFLSWSILSKQPSIRTLVFIELSAAFIAGRHLFFSYIQKKSQLKDDCVSAQREPDIQSMTGESHSTEPGHV